MHGTSSSNGIDYALPSVDEDLNNRFTFHAPSGNQVARYEAMRERARVFAHQICGACPPSRERSLALTKLDEVVFWANAAIARNEVDDDE